MRYNNFILFSKQKHFFQYKVFFRNFSFKSSFFLLLFFLLKKLFQKNIFNFISKVKGSENKLQECIII